MFRRCMSHRCGAIAVLLAASLVAAAWIAHAGGAPRPAAAQERTAPPAAPSGLEAAAGDGAAWLSWEADEGVTGYRYRTGPGARWRERVCDGVVLLTGLRTVRLTNGAAFSLELQARNGGGWGPSSAVTVTPAASATPLAAPDARPEAPSGVTARGGEGSIALSWARQDVVHSEHWLRYAYRLRPAGGEWIKWRANDCSYVAVGGMTLTGLGAGVTYEVQLRSRNAAGWSPSSATISVATSPGPGNGRVAIVTEPEGGGSNPQPGDSGDSPPPAAPAGLTAKAGDGNAWLSWEADAGVTGYRYRTGPGARWRERVCDGVVLLAGLRTVRLTNGAAFSLELQARNGGGWGPSSAVTVTPAATRLAAPDARPEAPSGVTARGGEGSIALSWARQDVVHSEHWLRYAYRLRPAGGEWSKWRANDCSYVAVGGMTLTGLDAGVTYEVQLRSRNAAGWSPSSATISVATR